MTSWRSIIVNIAIVAVSVLVSYEWISQDHDTTVCVFVCQLRQLSEFCGRLWNVLVKCNSVVCLLTSVESPKGLSVQPTFAVV